MHFLSFQKAGDLTLNVLYSFQSVPKQDNLSVNPIAGKARVGVTPSWEWEECRSGPVTAVEGAVLDGLGKMRHAQGRGALQVGDGSRDF